MKALTMAAGAALALLASVPAGAAKAAYYVETVLPGEIQFFQYNVPTSRPVRFLVSGSSKDLLAEVTSIVGRSEIGCFHEEPTGCWYYSEYIIGNSFKVEHGALNAIFDEDENDDCDPNVGEYYTYCDYRHILFIEMLAENSGSEAAKFRVKLTVVPEPATWALMLAGLGVGGAELRRRRRSQISLSATSPTDP